MVFFNPFVATLTLSSIESCLIERHTIVLLIVGNRILKNDVIYLQNCLTFLKEETSLFTTEWDLWKTMKNPTNIMGKNLEKANKTNWSITEKSVETLGKSRKQALKTINSRKKFKPGEAHKYRTVTRKIWKRIKKRLGGPVKTQKKTRETEKISENPKKANIKNYKVILRKRYWKAMENLIQRLWKWDPEKCLVTEKFSEKIRVETRKQMRKIVRKLALSHQKRWRFYARRTAKNHKQFQKCA